MPRKRGYFVEQAKNGSWFVWHGNQEGSVTPVSPRCATETEAREKLEQKIHPPRPKPRTDTWHRVYADIVGPAVHAADEWNTVNGALPVLPHERIDR